MNEAHRDGHEFILMLEVYYLIIVKSLIIILKTTSTIEFSQRTERS